MPESTTSQSPQEVFSSSGSDQWSQENNSNVVQNGTNLEWSVLPNHNVVPVASNITNQDFVPNGVNNNMMPMAYNAAQNFVNIPNSQLYQRHSHIQNGYPIVSIPNTQNVQAVPVLLRPHQRAPPHLSTWATQQNVKLIQPAWNKPTSGGVKKQKRVRTAFTSHQMMELEQEYARARYLDRTRRIELADILRLNERTIKIWFQNRRMKEKKDRTESLEEVEDVTTTQSTPELEVPTFHEQYQANIEAYNNRMGVFVEQYPVSSTSLPITSMPQAQMPPTYPSYAMQEECPIQYQHQQVHFQMQQYSSPYSQVQELSPELTPQSESSDPVNISVSSDVTEKNWDLSWIKSIKSEEE